MAFSPFAIQTAVTHFHEKYGHPIRSTPTGHISQAEAELSLNLIEEEVAELADSLFSVDYSALNPEFIHDPNIVEIADALGDIVWTAYSAAIRHGIDLDLVLAEIARSNDTKTPAEGPGAKIQKGPDYSAPDIARVLRTQPAAGGRMIPALGRPLRCWLGLHKRAPHPGISSFWYCRLCHWMGRK